MLVKLEYYVDLRQGLAINAQTNHLLSSSQSDEFKYPLLKIVDMTNNKFNTFVSNQVNKNVVAEKDDIIYTRTGQIGLAFRGFNGVVHNNSFIVTIKNDLLDKDYLFVILNSEFVRKQAVTMAKNSVQPDLTHNMFKSIKIPLYDINTQKKIAKILLNIENQIIQNKNLVKKLQVLGKAIYSKNVGNFSYDKLLNVSTITTGKEDANHSTINGKYKFFTCSDNVLNCDDYKFEGKSILVAGNGNFNVKYYEGKFNAYQRTYVIKNDYIIGNLYYTLLFNTELFRRKANGSIIKFITIDMLNNINVPAFTRDINNSLNKLLSNINTINIENDMLISLKTLLLPLLVNRQLE